MTFPSARDCEHGHQRGKCPECEAAEDIADLTASLEAAESEMRAWRDAARRLRTRVERLRGALKSAAGRAYEVAEFKLGDDCMEWAGDMEPPLMGSNASLSGGHAQAQEETKSGVCPSARSDS